MRIRFDIDTTELAKHILQTRGTIRSVAKYFGISKSTVYDRLVKPSVGYDEYLRSRVLSVLQVNKQERAKRGGYAMQRCRHESSDDHRSR